MVDKVYIVKRDNSFEHYDTSDIVFVSFNKDDAINFVNEYKYEGCDGLSMTLSVIERELDKVYFIIEDDAIFSKDFF